MQERHPATPQYSIFHPASWPLSASGSSPTPPPPNISPPSLSSTREYLGRLSDSAAEYPFSGENASAPLVPVGSCSVITLLACKSAIRLPPNTASSILPHGRSPH